MSKKTVFINLFGGPCVGKSTLCAMIFSELKMKRVDCEMALEYAKDVVWDESFRKLANQIYIFGKQHSRLYRLNGKVDVVITDSPLLNSIIYDDSKNPELWSLVLSEFKKLNTLNYFVQRNFEYDQNGRVQDYEGALEKDNFYTRLLEENKISYTNINPGNDNLSNVIDDVLNKLNESK